MSAALVVNAKPDLRETGLYVTILTSVLRKPKPVKLTTIVSTSMAPTSANVHPDIRMMEKTARILMNVSLESILVKIHPCAIIP
jgi:hypothetical protein